MKDFSIYDIPFAGLKPGLHHFVYEIDKEFLGLFPESPIDKAKVKVALDFYKSADFFVLDFRVRGKVKTECDRCSETFLLPIKGKYQHIIKFGEPDEKDSGEDDIAYISPLDVVYNVAQLLYEYTVLCIPIRKIHPNPEDCINDFEGNKPPSEDTDDKMEIDPRWAELKKINFDK